MRWDPIFCPLLNCDIHPAQYTTFKDIVVKKVTLWEALEALFLQFFSQGNDFSSVQKN